MDLAKALEVQENLVVPVERRRANMEGATRNLARGQPLSLGQLGRVLAEERPLWVLRGTWYGSRG